MTEEPEQVLKQDRITAAFGTEKRRSKIAIGKEHSIAPASTGSDNNNKNAVTRTDHANSGILCRVIPGARILKMVVMKLIAPRIDDAPAMCIDRITKSTAGPGCPDVESG